MSGAFDEVNAAVAGFARAWETLTPRLAEASGRPGASRERSPPNRVSLDHEPDLDQAAQRLDALTAHLSSDPLAVEPA